MVYKKNEVVSRIYHALFKRVPLKPISYNTTLQCYTVWDCHQREWVKLMRYTWVNKNTYKETFRDWCHLEKRNIIALPIDVVHYRHDLKVKEQLDRLNHLLSTQPTFHQEDLRTILESFYQTKYWTYDRYYQLDKKNSYKSLIGEPASYYEDVISYTYQIEHHPSPLLMTVIRSDHEIVRNTHNSLFEHDSSKLVSDIDKRLIMLTQAYHLRFHTADEHLYSLENHRNYALLRLYLRTAPDYIKTRIYDDLRKELGRNVMNTIEATIKLQGG